ncbi:hypothetical protein AVEN_226023-1 [Araneus ventricosus]|uniref:Uncharacterized protein n=1 Tax=Araneus ventricosus TaxID=182803 RepID=A0A4Y2HQF9_ARAVE|nr:hypothetical protein AVEN_226023-1 [Araneus ventricosus]
MGESIRRLESFGSNFSQQMELGLPASRPNILCFQTWFLGIWMAHGIIEAPPYFSHIFAHAQDWCLFGRQLRRGVSPSSILDKPRRDAVAAFRPTTGHDCLAAHLHRLGISTEPFCPLCDSGEVMESDHLLRCGALQGLTEVSRYWEARALLGQ